MLFESVAFAMGTPQAGGAAPSGGDMLMQFVPLILMFAIFWFLLIRKMNFFQAEDGIRDHSR